VCESLARLSPRSSPGVDFGLDERVPLYGLQDGAIFDFVTRTTPTGGGDLNFISQLFRGLGTFVSH
jgi:hypothetical protein